jgi:hypothetical protein
METAGRAAGEGGNPRLGPAVDMDSRFRLAVWGIIGRADLHARGSGANGHGHALDDRMVIRPSDVEAL